MLQVVALVSTRIGPQAPAAPAAVANADIFDDIPEGSVVSLDVQANDSNLDGTEQTEITVQPGVGGALVNVDSKRIDFASPADIGGSTLADSAMRYRLFRPATQAYSATAAVTLNMISPPPDPIAVADTFNGILEGSGVNTLVVTANDLNLLPGDVIQITHAPGLGSAVEAANDLDIEFIPPASINGPTLQDTAMTYRLVRGATVSASVAVTLNMTSPGDPYLLALDAGLSHQPIAHWAFDEASGTVLTDRYGLRHGTLNSSPTLGVPGLAPSTIRTAIRFTGSSSQWAGVPHSAAFACAQGMLCGWVRPLQLAAGKSIVSKSGSSGVAGDFDLVGYADGTVEFAVTDGSSGFLIRSPANYYIANQILHWAIIWGSAGFELHLDGVQVGVITAYTAGLAANARDFRFARAGWTDTNFSTMELDDVLFFNTLPTVGDMLLLSQLPAPS